MSIQIPSTATATYPKNPSEIPKILGVPSDVHSVLEPMINEGKKYITDPDPENGWTVYTEDGSLSAQWEYTVLITEKGPEILSY